MSKEWQVDGHGRHFRRAGGHCIEYEPDVVSTIGNFPKSVYDQIEKSRPATTGSKRETYKICPLRKSALPLCDDGCARYGERGCGLVTGDPPQKGRTCPLPGRRPCGEDCALWALCNRKEIV